MANNQSIDGFVSMAMGEWMPTGTVFFRQPVKSGGYLVVGVNFWGGEQLKPVYEWGQKMGLVAFENESKQKIACPVHGTSHLADDNSGRGKYCKARMGDNFCGWQSWKK